MALQFFSVHSEALAFTHDSLRRHAVQQGQRPPGPTRALRVAQLYGHLQVRSAGRRSFSLPVCELAASWRLQPRQLRQDLSLLQSLGWLEARGTTRGTHITLHPPAPGALSAGEIPLAGGGGEEDHEGLGPRLPAVGALSRGPDPAPHRPSRQAATAGRRANPRANSRVTPRRTTKANPGAHTAPDAEPALLDQLSALYNQHRPPSWPAYQPRGTALLGRIGQAFRHAGGPSALAAALRDALTAMPPFWRTTYPQGRSGAECFSALFQSDRANASLGVEFWHLFHWSQAGAEAPVPRDGGAVVGTGGRGTGGEAAGGGSAEESERLARARRLWVWDAGLWRGLGREALHLSQAEKRELTRLLEAQGIGIPGSADRQFPLSEAEQEPESDPASSDAGSPETPSPTGGLTPLEPSPCPSTTRPIEPIPAPADPTTRPATRRQRRQQRKHQALARPPTPPAPPHPDPASPGRRRIPSRR
jgi:hypothetical protein